MAPTSIRSPLSSVMMTILVTAILLTLLIPITYRVIMRLDLNKRVYNHKPGQCRTVEGIVHGAEDIELIRPLNIAFITSGIPIGPRPGVKGQIFLYDYNQPEGTYIAEPLKIIGKDFDPDQFVPHGIGSIMIGETARLFVVSHSPKGIHSVQIFDYDATTKTLKHVREVKDANFVSPNDVAAVGPDSFIVSNDCSGVPNKLLEIFEYIFNLSHGSSTYVFGFNTGSVYFFDNQEARELARNTAGSNGIWFNHDKKLLFVSMCVSESLSVYKFDQNRKSIELINDLPLLTCIDNLFEDENGAIWTGAHPVFKDVFEHFKAPDDPTKFAPSQVLRITFSPDYKKAEVVEVYANDGRELAGSASAIYNKNQLLVGSVMRTLLHCDVLPPILS